MEKVINGGDQVRTVNKNVSTNLNKENMKKSDLKSLLLAASENVNTVANNQTLFNSVDEFEETIVDNIIDTIRDSDYFHREYDLYEILLAVPDTRTIINIDGKLYAINANDARILQLVWNKYTQQIADTLTDKFGVTIAVNYNETENIQEYKEILEGLASENETDVLTTISTLLSRYTEIEERSEYTYVVTCSQYADCIQIALNYLNNNNKQFEGEHFIDIIATTDNDNIFVVLIK